MSSKQWFTFKYENEAPEIQLIHPYLLVVLAELVAYTHDRKWPAPIITSLARTAKENAEDGAESTSHMTLRAFDFSSRPYTEDQIKSICSHLNATFDSWAATNLKGEKKLAIYHSVPGGAFHCHIQIARRYELPEFKGLK